MSTSLLFQNHDEWHSWLSSYHLKETLSFKEVVNLQNTPLHLDGRISLALLPRLKSSLVKASHATPLYFSWTLNPTTRPFPQITLSIKTDGTDAWQLTCQRCMKPMPWTLKSESIFWIAANESSLEESGIPPEDDLFFHDELFTLLEHIEDEALLALPYSPRHPENQCKMSANLRASTQDKPHPFAVLARLKRTDSES